MHIPVAPVKKNANLQWTYRVITAILPQIYSDYIYMASREESNGTRSLMQRVLLDALCSGSLHACHYTWFIYCSDGTESQMVELFTVGD